MAFAKVQQQSRSFPSRQEQHVSLNLFDLSHDVKTTFTMGKLTPIFSAEVLPADQWFIRGEYMLRFAPLYLPIFHRVNMSVDYFFVPNRILWPLRQISTPGSEERSGWEVFINPSQPPNLVFTPQQHPYITVTAYDAVSGFSTYAQELIQYLGFPTALPTAVGTLNAFNINPFMIAGYYMIWDQFFRNDQIQDVIFTPLTAGDNTSSMPGVGTAAYLTCLYRNWNRDNFTSATPTPQAGSDVQIPLIDTDLVAPIADGPRMWKVRLGGTGAGAGDVVSDAGSMSEIAGNDVYLDIQETAASIAQLRYSLMLQEFLERAMRAGDRYSDFIERFFDVDPFKGVIQQPEWLGSKRGRVVISEVMSTTETATLKVGNYAGQAIALESTNDTIELRAKEHGVILGIMSVYPDSSYMQGIERMWTRELPTDYAWEQFALIGDQAILNKEVNAQISGAGTPTYNDEVFGYNRRYYEYMYKNDIYSGLMRTTFISFHLGRLLSVTAPQLTVLDSAFIQCRPDVTRVFQVAANEDEIYAHIYNDIKVRRRLPKQGIPTV